MAKSATRINIGRKILIHSLFAKQVANACPNPGRAGVMWLGFVECVAVSADPVSAAVAQAFRDERALVLATLIRQVGDFQLAEDAVQDAFEAAVTVWRRDGVPANPGAWVTTAARRRAIDRLRRNRSVADRAERLAELTRLDAQHEEPSMDDESTIVDDRLRLLFTCCHPALEMPARVALTLRALGGMTTGEIARAFL